MACLGCSLVHSPGFAFCPRCGCRCETEKILTAARTLPKA
jgi:hypothetical protein